MMCSSWESLTITTLDVWMGYSLAALTAAPHPPCGCGKAQLFHGLGVVLFNVSAPPLALDACRCALQIGLCNILM
jgi:hypothetical protein